jgi:hypothetical protein
LPRGCKVKAAKSLSVPTPQRGADIYFELESANRGHERPIPSRHIPINNIYIYIVHALFDAGFNLKENSAAEGSGWFRSSKRAQLRIKFSMKAKAPDCTNVSTKEFGPKM